MEGPDYTFEYFLVWKKEKKKKKPTKTCSHEYIEQKLNSTTLFKKQKLQKKEQIIEQRWESIL